MYTLATNCANQDNVTVDDADLVLIKEAVESTELFNNLVTGQLIKMLNELKDEAKTK
jgi:hypothetical protein